MAFKLNFLRMEIYRGKDYSKKENMKGNGFLILKMEASKINIHSIMEINSDQKIFFQQKKTFNKQNFYINTFFE